MPLRASGLPYVWASWVGGPIWAWGGSFSDVSGSPYWSWAPQIVSAKALKLRGPLDPCSPVKSKAG